MKKLKGHHVSTTLQETGPCLVGQAGSQALSPADQSTQLAGDPPRYAFILGTYFINYSHNSRLVYTVRQPETTSSSLELDCWKHRSTCKAHQSSERNELIHEWSSAQTTKLQSKSCLCCYVFSDFGIVR